MELYQARTSVALYSAYMVTWCLLTSIGIGIGIGISSIDSGPEYDVTVGFLQALAGGTILYVVVFEILERERSKNISGLGQLIFVILGFCAMLTVELAAPHNHEHGHEHEDDDHDHETTTTIIRTITKAMVY